MFNHGITLTNEVDPVGGPRDLPESAVHRVADWMWSSRYTLSGRTDALIHLAVSGLALATGSAHREHSGAGG